MFITPLDMRVLKGGKYQLLSPLGFKYKNIIITLGKGFVWDLASIPRVLWEEVGCPMDFAMESALHDALYASGLFPRDQADMYWYLALRSGGMYKEEVGKLLAKSLYYGVRAGGSSHYKDGSVSDARNYVRIEVM